VKPEEQNKHKQKFQNSWIEIALCFIIGPLRGNTLIHDRRFRVGHGWLPTQLAPISIQFAKDHSDRRSRFHASIFPNPLYGNWLVSRIAATRRENTSGQSKFSKCGETRT
jgi:hypothetical protein